MTDAEVEVMKSLLTEEWKQLYIFDEYQNYDISNFGKVKNHTTGFMYKPHKLAGMNNTYEYISIKLNDGKTLNTGIHRLVAITFIPIPNKYLALDPKELVVDHIDEIKYHNMFFNLQWLTISENITKSQNFATYSRTKTPLDVVHKICKLLEKGKSINYISKKCSCTELVVRDILYGLRYKNISKYYDFRKQKVDKELIKNICKELSNGEKTIKEIAKEFNVKCTTVTNISSRITYSDISKEFSFPRSRKENYDEKLIIAVCELLSKGIRPREAAKQLGVSPYFTQHIASRESYTEISKDYKFTYSKYKIDDETIKSVYLEAISGKYTKKEISKKYGVSEGFIKALKRKKHRKDLLDGLSPNTSLILENLTEDNCKNNQ